MPAANNKLMIITGEVSGDLIGASLIKELKSLNPDLIISGVGGDRMKEAGMNLIYHTDQMAFLGFVEVIKHLPFIHSVQQKLLNTIQSEKISGRFLFLQHGRSNSNVSGSKLRIQGVGNGF